MVDDGELGLVVAGLWWLGCGGLGYGVGWMGILIFGNLGWLVSRVKCSGSCGMVSRLKVRWVLLDLVVCLVCSWVVCVEVMSDSLLIFRLGNFLSWHLMTSLYGVFVVGGFCFSVIVRGLTSTSST